MNWFYWLSPLKRTTLLVTIVPVCHSWWSRPSLLRSSKRTPRRWRTDTRPTLFLWWTTSAITSPATSRLTAPSRRPIRNWLPWRSCCPALILTAELRGRRVVEFGDIFVVGRKKTNNKRWKRKKHMLPYIWLGLYYLQYIVAYKIYIFRRSWFWVCRGTFRDICSCWLFKVSVWHRLNLKTRYWV